jgi:hypothetical protein
MSDRGLRFDRESSENTSEKTNEYYIKALENEDKKDERSDRRHERDWVGWIIVIALCGSTGIYICGEGGKDFALAMLNIASVGFGYFLGKSIKS